MPDASANELPLRIGDPKDFARVARSLKEAGFDEATICRTLKLRTISALEFLKPDESLSQDVAEPLALFIRLFCYMELVPRAEVERQLEKETLDSFLTLDLLRIGDYGADNFYTPVFLYPVAGLLIVSDRHSNPDGTPYTPPPDIIFIALSPNTLRFLRVISKSPAETVLDLCSGTGIGALAMSRQATRAVASDITARTTHFALFNAMLNDCQNVEAVCGDVYDAVEGRTFDRIAAHPPYVPMPRNKVIWRDGGDTGEFILRRIIEGLPQYLRRGGTAYILSLGLDTQEGLLEERARRWLGDAESEFDIIFALGHEKSVQELLSVLTHRSKGLNEEEIKQMQMAFEREQTIQGVYGTLVLHRRMNVSVEPWTARVRLSNETEGADFEWAFKWHRQRQSLGFLERLANAKPQLSPSLKVKVTQVIHQGELVPEEFSLESDKPFHFATRFDGEVISLILQFNGQTTPSEIYAIARETSAMPDTFSLQDFTKLVAVLIDKGYLVLHDSLENSVDA
jgi:SAM-dependent methyltransferase